MIKALIETARRVRDSHHRHEQHRLTREEAAFYDALLGGVHDGDGPVDPQVAAIAAELVKSILADLTVDWADRESTEAAIRRKIKRLLRKYDYRPPAVAGSGGGDGGAHDLNHYTQLVLEQAKSLYRYWPEVDERLFEAT